MPFEKSTYAEKLTVNRRWGLPGNWNSHFELTLKSLSAMFGLGVKDGLTGVKYLQSDPRYFLPAAGEAEVGFRDGKVGIILSVRISLGLKRLDEFGRRVERVCEEMPSYHFWCEGEMFRCFIKTAHALENGYVSIDAIDSDLKVFSAVPETMRNIMNATYIGEHVTSEQLSAFGASQCSEESIREFCF